MGDTPIDRGEAKTGGVPLGEIVILSFRVDHRVLEVRSLPVVRRIAPRPRAVRAASSEPEITTAQRRAEGGQQSASSCELFCRRRELLLGVGQV